MAITLICIRCQASQTVNLAWNSPNNSDVAGYFLYCGTQAGVYTNRINIGNNTTAFISGLQEGQTYHFAVSAYNPSGTEGALSGDISYITPGLITSLTQVNPNSMTMKFAVSPDHWYEVQASADMRTWTTIGQTALATSNAWTQFTDPQAGQFSSRFYRLVLH